MDPNANLKEQDRLLKQYDRNRRTRHVWMREHYARLTELREALASWLDNGGFEPDWTLAPRAASFYGK